MRAAREVYDNGRRYAPGARIDGISIQEMAGGVEVIIGAVNDPQFGPYVMVGLGGVLTEVLGDVAHRFAPVGADMARDMLDDLRGKDILKGVRGSPPADLDALVDVIVRVSWLINDHADVISEIDINPLFVRPAGKGVVAADALIVPINGAVSTGSSRSQS